MDRHFNHYYEKFTETIRLKCGYDLDYIIKYVSCKKEQLQLQVSNSCHVRVNLAETSHTHRSIINVCLEIRLYDIIVCSCVNNNFFQI